MPATVSEWCRGKGQVYKRDFGKDFTKSCGLDVAGNTFKKLFRSV